MALTISTWPPRRFHKIEEGHARVQRGGEVRDMEHGLVAVLLRVVEVLALPDDVFLDPHLFEKVEEVHVVGEKDVERVVYHVPVLVEPRVGAAAENLVCFDKLHLYPLVDKIDRGGESRHAAAHN